MSIPEITNPNYEKDYELFNNLQSYFKKIEIDSVNNTTLTKEKTDPYPDKLWALLCLGFKSRGVATWYHPVLGEDKVENYINFSVYTDELFMIINKVYRKGWKDGDACF